MANTRWCVVKDTAATVGTFLGCLLWTTTVFSQSAPAVKVSATLPQQQADALSLPDTTRYRMFFWHVSSLQQLADTREKAGNPKSAAGWRTHDQRLAGLDEAEGKILTQLAADCNQALIDHAAKSKATVASIPLQKLKARPMDDSTLAVLRGLRAEKEKIVQSHLDSLRSALTESSFQKLDAYVDILFKSSTATIVPAQHRSSLFKDPDAVLPRFAGGAR